MTQINTFCTITLILASIMTAVHYAVAMLKRAIATPLTESEPPPISDSPSPAVDASGWLDNARQVAVQIATERGQVTVDEVWNVCPAPDGIDKRMMSAVFPRSEWEVVDYRASERGVNHGRRVAVHRLKSGCRTADRVAA